MPLPWPSFDALASPVNANKLTANLVYLAALPLTYDRTAAEISTAITPTNYGYLPGDIRRYGAVGNDSTNNYTAIFNAITAAAVTKGEVFIPPVGVFRFDTGLVLKAGVSLVGEGQGSVLQQGQCSVLKYTGAGDAITTEDVFPNNNNSRLENFKLTTSTESPSTGPGVNGVKLVNAQRVRIDCEIRGFSSHGVLMHSTAGKANLHISFGRGCHIHENGSHGVSATGVDSGTNAIDFSGCQIRANVGWNVHSSIVVVAWKFSGGTYEAGGLGAIHLSCPVGLSIHGAYFEQTNSNFAIELGANATKEAKGVSIKGCFVMGNGTGEAVKLGGTGIVSGIDISGNWFYAWNSGINPAKVVGGQIGPNYMDATVVTPVVTPGSLSTGLAVHTATAIKHYSAPLVQLGWSMSAWRPIVASVKDYGAIGDGVANDTAAIAAAHADALHVYYPPGIYLTDQITLTGYGRSMIGAGNEGTGATGATGLGTTIKARGTQTDLLRISGQNHCISWVTLNGNFTTDNVVRLVPSSLNIQFDHCTIERAVAATGRLVYNHSTFGGASTQGDLISFDWCVMKQDASNNANKALYCFEIVGTNAFDCELNNCILHSAANLIKITDGAGLKVRNCQGENFTTSIFALTGNGGFQKICVDGFYTENAGGVFWTQATSTTAGPLSTPTIELNRLHLNNANLDITLDILQPIIIRDSRISGNVILPALGAGVTPLYHLIAENVQFPTGKGFTGVNAGAIVQRSVTINNVLQRDLAPGAAVFVNTTAIGNVGTGTDTLMFNDIPANAMHAPGRGIAFRAWGTAANNANAKTLRVTVGGGTHVLTSALTVSQAGKWVVDGTFISTGVDTQDFAASLIQSPAGASDIGTTTSTFDDGAAITLSFHATATADNDIVQEGLIVRYL